MIGGKRSVKYYALTIIFLLILGGVWLISNLSKESDPLIFEHEDKTLNFDATSFYGGTFFELQRGRDISFEIINSSEILIFCKESSTNYMLFAISLKNDTYDVNIDYINEFGVDLSKDYFDLGYNIESELSLIQASNGEAYQFIYVNRSNSSNIYLIVIAIKEIILVCKTKLITALNTFNLISHYE